MTMVEAGAPAPGGRLRAGDWVEVRSKEEILQTLDKQGRLENMPFMPGMFAYCGRRLRVGKTAHKSCDTLYYKGGRRMSGDVPAVHLEDVRCDGAEYEGCQAGCLIFWKEAWLKRVDGPGDSSDTNPAKSGWRWLCALPASARRRTSWRRRNRRRPRPTAAEPTYRLSGHGAASGERAAPLVGHAAVLGGLSLGKRRRRADWSTVLLTRPTRRW